MINLTIPGVAQPQQSVRSRVITGKGKPYASHYQPKNSPAGLWKQTVHQHAILAMDGREPLDGALEMGVCFHLPKPKSVKREHPEKKPDLDNLLKPLLDALEGVLFVNDSRIVDLYVTKVYGDPRVEIWIKEVDDGH